MADDQTQDDSGSNTVYSHDDLMELLNHLDGQRKQAVSLYKSNPVPQAPVNSTPGSPQQNRIDLSNTDWSRRRLVNPAQQPVGQPKPPTYVPGQPSSPAGQTFQPQGTLNNPDGSLQAQPDPEKMTAAKWIQQYHQNNPNATMKEIMTLAKQAKDIGLFDVTNPAFAAREKLQGEKDAAAMARLKEHPELAGLSEDAKNKSDIAAAAGKKSEEEIGKARGTEEVTYAKLQAGMPAIEKAVNNLSVLSNTANYTVPQNLMADARREMGLPVGQGAVDAAQYESVLNNVLLPRLRSIFGARVTNFDVQAAAKMLGNPKLSPPEKQAQLKSFIAQATENVQTEGQTVKNLGGNPSPAMKEDSSPKSSSGAVDYTEYFK